MDVTPAIHDTQSDLMRAALLGLFDPRALVGSDTDRLSALATAAIEQELGGQWFWALTPDARVTGLSQLPMQQDARAEVLDSLPALLPGDDLGAALRLFLREKADKATSKLIKDARSDRSWTLKKRTYDPNVLAQALKLLTEARVNLADWATDPSTARALRRAVVLDRRAQAAHMLLPTPFRGRGREMRVLQSYVQTGALHDLAANPVLDPMGASPPANSVTALAVIGMGGTGKSALIEALSRSVEADRSVTFLEFDLDQTSLRAGERVAMTMELTRQVALFHPDLDQALSTLRGQLRQRVSARGEDSVSLDQSASAVLSALSDLGQLMTTSGMTDHGFALVFDTFEQALVAGEARVRLIADWLKLLRDVGQMKQLRVILSGREADLVAKLDTPELRLLGRIELGDLGTNAGRAKLRDMFRRFGIAHLDQVPDLIATYGSNPLVIEIVANFCRDRRKTEIRDLAAGQPELVSEFNAETVQRFLYTRTLERIKEEDLRPLASPGLILRHITPGLIESVLAGPCGFDVPLPAGKATDLYERLSRQVWLVREARDGNALEHIPDLRRVMLPQILSLPEATSVLEAAAAWFRQRYLETEASDDLLEAQYYSALLDTAALNNLEPVQLLRLGDYLGASVADLPLKAQALLREASGALLSRAEIETLSGDVRDRAATKRSARQVAEGLESSVLEETDPDRDMGADVVRAHFANAEFSVIAKHAGTLCEPVFKAAFGNKSDASSFDFDLSHPAWLATLSNLETANRAFTHQTVDHPVFTHARNKLQSLKETASNRVGVPFSGSELLARLILAVVQSNTARDDEEPDLGFQQDAIGGRIVVENLVAWRLRMMQVKSATAEDIEFSVLLQDLPFLNSQAVDLMLNFQPRFIAPGLKRKAKDYNDLLVFTRDKPVSLSDIAAIRDKLAFLDVRLNMHEMPPALYRVAVPGLLPEFHAPLRLLLEQVGPDARLSQAIASLTDHLPWWPPELAPDLFKGNQYGPTLISSLLSLIDMAGHLPDLARALAKALPDDEKLTRISGLIDAFCALMRGDRD